MSFFSALNNAKHREQLKLPITPTMSVPLTLGDFLRWLKEIRGQDFYAKQQKIIELIGLLSRKNFLIEAGHGKGSPPFYNAYYFIQELSTIEQKGCLFLGKYLGLRFIANITKANIARIIGKTNNGEEHIGSGILVTPNIVLTCAHVLNDMKVESLEINNIEYKIQHYESHFNTHFITKINNRASRKIGLYTRK